MTDLLPMILADFEDWGELLIWVVIMAIYGIGAIGKAIMGAGKKDRKRPGGQPRPQRSFGEAEQDRQRIDPMRQAHQRPPRTAGAAPRTQQPGRPPASVRDRAEQQRQRVAQRIQHQQQTFRQKEAQVRLEAAEKSQAHLQQWQRQIERQKALAAQRLREKQQAEQTARRQQQASARRTAAPVPPPAAPVRPAARPGDLLAHLQDRDTLRSAFVLKEILGPPVSLRQ